MPNVVVIMADDMGFSDLGSYGSEIQTPSLDRLADHGVRFSQFYNTARCSPTRASLLTGLYSHSAGVGQMTVDRDLPGYRGHLTENAATIAEILRNAGYQTGMVGKWHVSNTLSREDEQEQLEWLSHRADYGDFAPREQYPTRRGFDRFFGNIWGVVDFFDPFSLVSGEEPVRSVPDDYYHTDAISDSAVAYVHDFANEDAPFFLYVAHTAPHWPLHALPEDIAKYDSTYAAGWDAIRNARYQRLVDLGILDPETTLLSPRIEPDLQWETHPDRAWDARAMAVHAAMIDRMDQGIGRLVAALEEMDELENTLIIFLSDNGASHERAERFGPGFDRPATLRSGEPIAYPVLKDVLPGPQNTYAAIGPMGANVMNTPFRFWKRRLYEGGISTPLVVHWSKGITIPDGSIIHQPGHVIDLLPTILAATGVAYPDSLGGREITPVQGKNLLPLLRGVESAGHDTLFWEHYGARAVRAGHWKIVAYDGEAPWELYDMETDRSELHDLAATHPDRVAELDSLWQQWAVEHWVVPAP